MKDEFTRQWIIETGVPIIQEYDGNLTIRALHYRLVAAGMTNTVQHYKRVVSAMGVIRRNRTIGFDAFRDLDRDVEGATFAEPTDVETGIEVAKIEIKAWADHYSKNRWENQPFYPEVFIEKKALQGVFEKPCRDRRVALCPCKGYPSLTYIYDATIRFREAVRRGQVPIILYFGDYDPSGEDIPRSIGENILEISGIEVEVCRFALMEQQVIDWNLPPAPAKTTDSRSASWDGLGQVELDAVEPKQLNDMVVDAIESVFDADLHIDLKIEETKERKIYRETLRNDIPDMFIDSDEDE